jgi:hypothetical protein
MRTLTDKLLYRALTVAAASIFIGLGLDLGWEKSLAKPIFEFYSTIPHINEIHNYQDRAIPRQNEALSRLYQQGETFEVEAVGDSIDGRGHYNWIKLVTQDKAVKIHAKDFTSRDNSVPEEIEVISTLSTNNIHESYITDNLLYGVFGVGFPVDIVDYSALPWDFIYDLNEKFEEHFPQTEIN